MTHRRAISCIVSLWSITLAYYGIFIIYDNGDKSSIDYSVTCDFVITYCITDLIIAFILPAIFLLYFNVTIMINIHKRARGLIRSNQIDSLDQRLQDVNLPPDERGVGAENLPPVQQASPVPQESIRKVRERQHKIFALRRDRKAAIKLAMIVVIYVICWLPFYILRLISFEIHFSVTFWNAIFYLVWLNSALNPFIHAIASPQIRKNLVSLRRNCCRNPMQWCRSRETH